MTEPQKSEASAGLSKMLENMLGASYRIGVVDAVVDPKTELTRIKDKALKALELYVCQREAEAEKRGRIDENERNLKLNLGKHFTSWGGAQGNCVDEDAIVDRIRQLKGE